MAGDGDMPDLLFLLHELAEGLQSVGNYLGAARRAARTDPSEGHPNIDIVEKALDELSRSRTALRRLRARLLVPGPETGVAASANPPMTWRRCAKRG
jgi:hypothetical protein